MQVQGAKEFFSLFLILVPRVGNCWKVLSNGVTWSDVLFKERAWLCISGFTGELEQAFSTLAGLTFGPDKSLLMRGPVHCRVCRSVPDLYPLGAAVTSSLSRDKKNCVQHEHGQGGQLGRAVPAITAVHHHRRLSWLHPVSNPESPCKNKLKKGFFKWIFFN